jgi:hypothetical protein
MMIRGDLSAPGPRIVAGILQPTREPSPSQNPRGVAVYPGGGSPQPTKGGA